MQLRIMRWALSRRLWALRELIMACVPSRTESGLELAWRRTPLQSRIGPFVSTAAAKDSVTSDSGVFPASCWAVARPIYASTIRSLTDTAVWADRPQTHACPCEDTESRDGYSPQENQENRRTACLYCSRASSGCSSSPERCRVLKSNLACPEIPRGPRRLHKGAANSRFQSVYQSYRFRTEVLSCIKIAVENVSAARLNLFTAI